MALKLNEAPSTYKEFFGSYRKMMPALIADDRTPLSVADIMRRRLEVANSNDPQLRSAWLDNYFDTSDGIAYHPNGKAKVVLDAVPLRTITPGDPLQSGALLINEDIYQRLDGPTFSRSETPSGGLLTRQDVLANPIWQTLARDQSLLREYTSLIFTDAMQRFGYEENMSIYLRPSPETPQLRAWCVNWIHWSDLYGGNDLVNGNARLVGVAPEAPARTTGNGDVVPPRPGLDQVLSVTAPYIAPANTERLQADLTRLYR